MLKTKIFRRQLLIFIGVITAFLTLGFVAHIIVIQNTGNPFGRPEELLSRLLAKMPAEERASALKSIEDLPSGPTPFAIQLADENGNIIYPTGSTEASFSAEIKNIKEPYERLELAKRDSDIVPRGPRPKMPAPSATLLPGLPKQYLIVRFNPEFKPEGPAIGLAFFILVLSLILGVVAGLYFTFRTIHNKSKDVDFVIAELRSGNLKARLPIRRLDEVGQVMQRFNKMADEIEYLVEKLRDTEKARMLLLQQLAHDLRTPIASLKSLIETLSEKGDQLAKNLKEEVLSLSLREIQYFERLVEDLLLIAQVSEPKYQLAPQPIAVSELVEESIESYNGKKGIEIKRATEQEIEASLFGDRHLLRRAIRNAIENAKTHAKSSVLVDVVKSGQDVVIRISDDGPGFSQEALEQFGVRRVTRKIQDGLNGKVSTGLGSVIMRNIVELHRGSICVMNRVDSSNRVLGALVEFSIPIN